MAGAGIESGLRKLRARIGPEYTPGLILAEEFCQGMRERQP